MSTKATKHSDLLAVLADLPPSKVEEFVISLGVPKTIVEESQRNHPHDIYRVKSDALSWWLANDAEVSWDAVAKALEAKGVHEQSLAKRIRSSHGLISTTGNSKSYLLIIATKGLLCIQYKRELTVISGSLRLHVHVNL